MAEDTVETVQVLLVGMAVGRCMTFAHDSMAGTRKSHQKFDLMKVKDLRMIG